MVRKINKQTRPCWRKCTDESACPCTQMIGSKFI